MVTIRDVAEKAGVSVATVSRYINGNGYVGKKTAQNLGKVIKELNYHPSEVARSLNQKKSKLVGLLLPDISNPFYPLLAKGVEDELNEVGYTVMLGNVEESSEKLSTYMSTFISNNVVGIISASSIDKTIIGNIPYISVDRTYPSDQYSVTADSFEGGVLQAKAILKTTFKRIVVMVGPESLYSSQERLLGIKSVFDTGKVDYELFYTQTHEYAESYDTTLRFFDEFTEVDTVVASSDVLALSIMREAIQRNIKIPKELQIIGYDNISFSRIMQPQLDTIAQFSYQQGKKAAQILLKLLNGEKNFERNLVVPVKYIEGNSLRKK